MSEDLKRANKVFKKVWEELKGSLIKFFPDEIIKKLEGYFYIMFLK